MFSEIAKIVLDVLKLAPRYLVALGIVAGLLLFADASILKNLSIEGFATNNRQAIGLVFVSCIALLLVSTASWVWSLISSWRASRAFDNAVIKRLNNLTEQEKQILRFYVAENTKSNLLRIESGVVQGLRSSGIIYQSASVGDILQGFAHNISDFAWSYIHRYPHILQGTTNTYYTDRRDSRW